MDAGGKSADAVIVGNGLGDALGMLLQEFNNPLALSVEPVTVFIKVALCLGSLKFVCE